MLKRLLRHIRRKPKAVRDQIALVTAGVFTMVVMFAWAFHFPDKLTRTPQEQENIEKTPGFSQLFSGLKDIKDQFATLKEAEPAPTSTVEVQSEAVSVTPATTTAAAEPEVVGSTSSPATTTPPRAIRIATVRATSTATSSVPERP